MKQYYTSFFAQAYGQGTYGECVYNNTQQCVASGSGSSSGSGLLTNTGFDIALIVTLACVLIFTALAVRLWRKSSRTGTPSAEPVLVDDDQDDQDPNDTTRQV